MSPSYAKATAAFVPANELPQPDPAFLNGLQPANRKIAPRTTGQKGATAEGLDYTPPLTPPSETANHDKELGSKKQHGEAESESGLKQRKSNNKSKAEPNATEGEQKKKEAPGAGFAQSIKGTVSEERYVPTDLDQRIAQPCECTRVFRPTVSRQS